MDTNPQDESSAIPPQMPSQQHPSSEQPQPNPPFQLPYNGWLLLALTAGFVLSIWLIGIDSGHTTAGAAGTIGTLLFLGVLVAVLAFDWHGFITLAGLINWQSIHGQRRFWLILAFIFFFEVFLPIYLVRVIRDYYRITQQRPQEQMRDNWRRYRAASRGVQAAIALAAAVGLCFVVSISALALTGGSSENAAATTGGTSTTGQVDANRQQTQAPQLPPATAAPAQTATPTLTPTPKPSPTPTHTPQWTTVQTFHGNGISKTAPFTINDDQWKIVWSCNPAAYGSSYNLIADLTHPGEELGDGVVNVICDQSDPSTLQGETMEYTTGTFYLDVNSEASWTFQIQVLK